MQRFHSEKTLMEVFSIDQETAKEIKKIVKCEDNALLGEHSVIIEIERTTYNPHSFITRKMLILNELLEMCGVEAIFVDHDHLSPLFSYLNTGDLYCPTIVYNHSKEKFQVLSEEDMLVYLEKEKKDNQPAW